VNSDLPIKSIEFDAPGGSQTIDAPTWEIVERELRALDGASRDSVCLDAADGRAYMGISGGENMQFVVAGFLDGFGSYLIAEGEPEKARIQIAACHDHVDFASVNVVGLETAVRAARYFYENVGLDPSLRWAKQES